MNDYVAKITLDLNCQATPIVISAGQYDIGRQIKINLTADGEAYDATGATAVCKGKSGSNYFAVNATVAKNIVTVTTDKAMLSSAGRTVAKIVLTDGTRTYSTQPFVINTHSDYDGDITTSDYYPELLDILSRVLALTESGAVLTDTKLSATSVNPLQNKVLTPIINTINNRLQSTETTLKNKANKATTLAGYGITDAYTKNAIDASLANKADKATTLDGYGITDAYTQSQIKAKLDQKLKKMPFDSEPKQESPCYLTSGAVYNALLAKADKASTLAGYGITDAYTKNAVDASLANKADKATTLAGYGITDTYTQSQIKTRLEEKLKKMPFDSEPTLNSPCYLTSGTVYNALLAKADKASTLAGYGITDAYTKNAVDALLANKANLINSSNIFDFDAWAKGLQSLTNPVYKGTLEKVDYNEKSFALTATESMAYTNGWTSSAPQSMRIAVKPNTKYLFSWLPSSTNCKAFVFLNGTNTTATRFELKKGFGSFTTAEDTTYILIRFDYNGTGFFKVSEIMITEKESIYLPNKVAEGVPEVANEVLTFEKTTQTSLDGKYDSSNVEVGKGELTPAQATYDGYEGSFNYSKIGKTVTVALNITTLVAGKNYVQFAGLPFTAMTASKLSSIVAYTTANKLVNIRLHGSWLYISSPGTTFAEGEKINSIITYIIN